VNQLDWLSVPSVPGLPSRASHRPVRAERPEPSFPRVRSTDPRSSHEAAAQADRFAASQAQRVLTALRQWPGSTSMELAAVAHLDRYATARRLPELLADGFVTRREPTDDTKPCEVSRKRVCRWWPTR
jgi:hypothetical protein